MLKSLRMRSLVDLFFLSSVVVFLVLLARNPYSQRTLIPNLEPYPDSMHYVVPARSMVSGGLFKIIREERVINPSVPPLYSAFLAPFYLVNNDPRTYYFANVTLALLSIYLLFLILKLAIKDKWIIGVSLFLFTTNFYMYWYPQWAMAENLILPIFLFAVLLLIKPVSNTNIIFASIIPFLSYSTKYAYLPLAGTFVALYVLKVIWEKKTDRVRLGILFILLSSILFLPILIYQSYMQEINPLIRYFNILVGTFSFGNANLVIGSDKFVGSGGWFSELFFQKNFPIYVRGLLGEKARFLWDYTPLLPNSLIFPAWTGMFMGLFKKGVRYFSFSLMLLLALPLIFISTFSTQDMRYVYHSVPTLILGISLFLFCVKDFLSKKKLYAVFVLGIFIIGGLYIFKNFQRLRYQTALNLKYAETPWYYISVLKLNDYFTKDKFLGDKIPYVISPMPPYYIDFYSNGNYRLLPLDKDQEFRQSKEAAWGYEDYSDFHGIYKKYLLEGYPVYVSTYGLGNEFYLHEAFDELSKDFKLTEVQNECYTQCKIYKLEFKNAKSI